MSRLPDLKRRLGDSADASKALGDLTEFSTIVTLGTTASGGLLTLPLVLVQSSKAAGALLTLTKLLLSESKDIPRSEPAERADDIFYVFAQRAFLTALSKLEGKVGKKAQVDRRKFEEVSRKIEAIVLRPELADASFQFGWQPADGPLPLFESYAEWISTLLVSMGVEQRIARGWMEAVEKDARKALHRELASRSKDRTWMVHYQLLERTATILDHLHSFATSTTALHEAAWERYLAGLAAKPTLPIWGEEKHGLGIDRLFVEAEYAYSRHLPMGGCVAGTPATEVSIKAFLAGLLSRRTPSSELVFVMGGPGTGKTSLMEVLAGELAASGSVAIVLVPAKRLDPHRALLPEVQAYLRAQGHGSIAELIASVDDCILAIDGFDELAHATLSSLEHFFRGAQELVRERSAGRMRILLSGRPTLFAANDVAIPAGSHVVTLQPFDRRRVAEWSENWRKATNGTFDATSYLDAPSTDVQELASQPMLLYLLAKMHEEGKRIPENLPATGGVRFRIYAQILDWVCGRQEGKGIPTASSVRLRRFLQIAGLATHQSGQRTLHWRHFARALEQAGLVEDPKELDAKVHSTILAFAFTSLENRAWEFTHKSFGEALAAEAIGRVLEDVCDVGRDGEPWRVALPVAAKTWLETFGPHFLTKDVMDFCSGWLHTQSPEFLTRLMARSLELFNHLLGQSVSESLAAIATRVERPVHTVLGNSVRSWLAITNENLHILQASVGTASLEQWANTLDGSRFRDAVHLSNLVSPISVGESAVLLRWTSRLLASRRAGPSERYLKQLREIMVLFSSYPIKNQRAKVVPQGSSKMIARELYGSQVVLRADLDTYENLRLFGTYTGRIFNEVTLDRVSPIESLYTELETTLLHGYEPHPADELFTMTGVDVRGALSDSELRRANVGLTALVESVRKALAETASGLRSLYAKSW
jgi:hypothetical protein